MTELTFFESAVILQSIKEGHHLHYSVMNHIEPWVEARKKAMKKSS